MFKKDDGKTKDFVNWTVFLLFLFVGLPLWWKTTEVYRAPLPDVQIEHLHDQNKVNITVEIALLSVHYDVNFLLEELKKLLNDQKSYTDNNLEHLVQVNYNIEAIESDKTEVKTGSLVLEFLKGKNKLIISEGRKIKISTEDTLDFSLTQVVDVIKDKIVNEGLLNDAAREVFYETQTVNTNLLQKMVKDSNEYEVLISLLISQHDDEIVSWNIQEAVELKLSSFLNKLKKVYDKVSEQKFV